MSCYISSNDNRVYAALETSLGTLAAVTSQHRVPTVKLSARQRQEPVVRRDKTGSRTFPGLPNRVRRQSDFKLNSPMTAWADMTTGPSHGPLFQAALGGQPRRFSGVTVATVTNGVHITTTAAHGLQPGQAVTHAGELRFVSAVESATGFFLNGPFTQSLTAGAGLGITMRPL